MQCGAFYDRKFVAAWVSFVIKTLNVWRNETLLEFHAMQFFQIAVTIFESHKVR